MSPGQQIFLNLVVIFFAIGLHEYAHCKVTELMGDPTPRLMGRVTLNLFKHFDPAGAVMIVLTSLIGFGIGWGKPAPANPSKMKNPRWGMFLSVAAGPLCNVLQAIVYSLILRVYIMTGHTQMEELLPALCFTGVLINVRLALFNLIPLGPLDGHWLVGLLMPPVPRLNWFKFNRQYGFYALIGLVFLSQSMAASGGPSFLSMLISPAANAIYRILLGGY